MANFKVEERIIAPPGQPGAKVPEASKDALVYMGDGMFFMYRHDHHTERDLFRPGYFDSVVEKNAGQFLGGLILYTACGGKSDPAEWSTGFLRITQVRGARGVATDGRTQVAIVARFHKATAVGHDGAPDETTSKKAA